MLDLNVTKVSLAAPVETQNVIYKNLQNEGPGFGGSINMDNLFTRLTNVRSSLSSRPTTAYPTAQTVVRNENGVEVSRVTTATTTPSTDRRYYASDGSGMYYYYNTNSSWLYMYQETMTVTNISYTGEVKNGYTISDGTRYLNLNANANGVTTTGDATAWVFENGRIYAYSEVDGQPHYLNGNGSLTVSTTASTTNWTWTNNHFSCTYNNVTYCLRYNNGWEVAEEYYYVITDGNGNYLTVTGTTSSYGTTTATLGNTTNLSNASHWTFSTTTNGYPTGTISTTYNSQTVYLRYDNGLTATSSTYNRTTWSNNGTSIYPSNNTSYYLKFDGTNWVVAARGTYYAIRSGSNYLNITAVNGNTATLGTGTSIANVSSANGHTLWTFSTTGTNPSGTISATVGSTTYYLRDDNGTLTATTANNPTSWSNSSGAISYNGDYIRLINGEWTLKTYPIYAIRNATNGNYYLNLTGAGTIGTGNSVADESTSNHTYWSFSDTSGTYPAGTISATYNGVTYYLYNNNGAPGVTTDAASASEWTSDGTHIYTGSYYLNYSNGAWILSTVGNTISSGNYYLNLTGAGTIGTGNSVATITYTNPSRTGWVFTESGGNVTISATYNGTTYYLYYYTQNGNRVLGVTNNANSATAWEYDGTNIHVGDYYVNYNNGWKLTESVQTLIGYTISDGSGHYLNATSTSAVGNGTASTSFTNDGNGHTVWNFSGDFSGTISTKYTDNTSYYFRYYRQSLSLSTTSSTWTNPNNANVLRVQGTSNSYYLRYNNGWSVVNVNSGNGTTLTFTPVYSGSGASPLTITAGTTPNAYVSAGTTPTLTVTSETEPAPYTQAERISSAQILTRADATVPVMRNDGTTTENSSYASAFPINVYTTSPYAANPDTNTGYIVAGGYSAASSSGRGDIRVSQYGMPYIFRALSTNTSRPNSLTYNDSRLEVITGMSNGTYTGWYRVSDDYNKNNTTVNSSVSGVAADSRKINYKTLGLKRYEDARASMSSSFTNSSNIYGLHFMDAAIDIDNIVTLPKAYIEGEEYTNYPVPNDSIDFNVKRRGFITVFAGTYYGGNTSFFSLHQISRYKADDPEVLAGTKKTNDLKEIKEISQIYKPLVGDDFIYKYTDGTYSDGKSASDCGTIAFDMVYMTNPGSAMVENAVYYFEIPVNGGEFALGSVPGKDGAYLFYLDIAANGGQAEDKDRVTISERFTEQNYDVTLPAGVQLIDENGAYDAQRPYETVTVALADGYNGAYTFTRTGSVFTYNAAANTELTYIGGALTASNGQGTTVNYYPNGYTVTTVENITDTGRTTNLVEKMRIETVDAYDEQGAFESRTVTVYTGVDITDNPADFVEIVSFTYDPSTHANMKTRVVRAASSGGFNIVFDQQMVLTATVTNENVHVNFGDNTSNYMQTVTAADSPASLTLRSETVINMTNDEPEQVYYTAVIGPDIAAYYSYVEGGDGVERDTAPTLTTTVGNETTAYIPAGTANATQSLNYSITLTSSSEILVYATQLINTYGGTTYVENSGGTAAQSATFTVNSENTPAVVTVNGTALEKNVPKEIVIAAPQQSTP